MTNGSAAGLRQDPAPIARLANVAGVITDSTAGRNRPTVLLDAQGIQIEGATDDPPRRDLVPDQPPRMAARSVVTSSIDFMPSTVFSSPVEA